MKRTKIVAGLILIILGGCICIFTIITNRNPTGNRYASMYGYEEDLIFYANHNIYQYSDNGNVIVLAEDVSMYFSLNDDRLYYVRNNEVICTSLSTNDIEFTYKVYKTGLKDLETYIYNNILVVSTFYGEEQHTYLEKDTGKEVASNITFDEMEFKDVSILNEDNFEKFLDGCTNIAITTNDILYARYPYGNSYISSYQVVRDQSGEIEDLVILKDVLPYSDKHNILWNIQNILFIFILPIVCVATGILIMVKYKK